MTDGASAPETPILLRIRAMQAAIAESGLDGWLLFDFHGTNPIARQILGMSSGAGAPKTTRRWFYWIPASGDPSKLVHRLEPKALDHLPGSAVVYSPGRSWRGWSRR